MTTLPAFRRTPSCPKCGSQNIGFEFREAADEDSDRDVRQARSSCGWTKPEHVGEHIHLSCTQCSYGKDEPWIMAVAESARQIGFRLSADSTDTLPE